MKIISDRLHFDTTNRTDIIDITGHCHGFLSSCGGRKGILNIFIPGSTASVTTIEFEDGAVSDLKDMLEEIAPADKSYQHNLRWHDGNGYSHVRAALLKSSMTIPVENGKLILGTWQQLILCDFDNKRRQREVFLQFMGE